MDWRTVFNKCFDPFVCVLISLDIILLIIFWYRIIGSLIYPNLDVILIPLMTSISLWILLKIRYNLNYEKPKKPKSYRGSQYLGRAWGYYIEFDHLYASRINFFLVAESMLLLSFITAFQSGTNYDIIQLTIAVVGILVSFYWFYSNVRLRTRMEILLEDYLVPKDLVFYYYAHSVRRFVSSHSILSYLLPNTFILFWFFLFLYVYNDGNVDIFVFKMLSVLFWILIIINVSIKVFLRKKN